MHIRDWELITSTCPLNIAANRWMQSYFDECWENGEYVTEEKVREAYIARANELDQHPLCRFHVDAWWLLNWWRFISFWSQNLSSKRSLEFRGSVSVDDTELRRRINARIGWSFAIPTSFWHLKLELGGEDHFGFAIAFGIVAIWIKLQNIIPKSWFVKLFGERWWAFEREYGIAFHNGMIWLDWARTESWNKNEAGKHWSIDVFSLLFGEQQYKRVKRSSEIGVIDLPERSYYCNVELFTSTWWRSRFPGKESINRATVNAPCGIPVPGNPEKDYYDGDDAIYSLTCAADTIEEAISNFKTNVLETRLKYGGENWKVEQ